MNEIVIYITAFFASGLTLFSGFGLGTILLPAFAFFFPLNLAIAMTALTHFLNNLLKLGLFVKYAHRNIILYFGLPAILAAYLGAWALSWLSNLEPVATYVLFGKALYILPVKVIVAFLMMLFAFCDILPFLKKLSFGRRWLPIGGILSGFIGGLSGHQGALRSAFLIRCDLTKEAFIGTGVVIACLVDISRMGVYAASLSGMYRGMDYLLVAKTTLFAFLGVWVANRFLKKMEVHVIQKIVFAFLVIFSLALGSGIV